mmetsp:Transcript_13152/g.20644  ORF Transcript_13152/g.20644 Transcript_13152/m.20644 type:complete len:80 (+) Transcript_13152:111-350(+)
MVRLGLGQLSLLLTAAAFLFLALAAVRRSSLGASIALEEVDALDPYDYYNPPRPADMFFDSGCKNFRWNRGIMECGDGA